jgi:hypothetical protein
MTVFGDKLRSAMVALMIHRGVMESGDQSNRSFPSSTDLHDVQCMEGVPVCCVRPI